MKKRSLLGLILAILIVSCFFNTVIASTPEITGTSAILIDANSGNVLYEKNPDQQMPPASTTKVMTLLLAAEYGKMDEEVVVDYSLIKDLPSDASVAYFQQDEITTLKELFMSAYLISANDAAVLIANHVGGNVENFVVMMNNRAKELGCTSTNFENPTGLYEKEHYVSVRDMTLIAKAIYDNKLARELISQLTYTLPSRPCRPDPLTMSTNNGLLQKDNSNYYPSVVFGKTGYVDLSKHTIVSIAQKDDTTLICTSFHNEERQSSYNDVKQMFDHGFGDFYSLTITKAELENLFSGKRNETISPEGDIKLVIPSTVKRDTLIRTVEVSDGEAFISVKGENYDFIKKISNVEEKKNTGGFLGGIIWLFKWILKIIFFIILTIIALYLVLTIYINIRNKKKLEQKKRQAIKDKNRLDW